MQGLSNRHELFAQLAASGETGAGAYRAAYGAEGASAEVGASRLLRNDKVSTRVAELQKESATMTTLDMQRRREILKEIANDPKAKHSDRINAVMADAKLAGELTEKQEVTRIENAPNAPLVVSLPTIITTPRRRREYRDKQADGLPTIA